MNHIQVSQAVGRELQLISITVRRTGIFLNIEPAENPGAGGYHAGGRMKYWGKIGIFFGGMLGIVCGFVLSCLTNLGSLPVSDMLLCWAAMCLVGALLAGSLCSLGAGLLQFRLSRNETRLPVGRCSTTTGETDDKCKRENQKETQPARTRTLPGFTPSILFVAPATHVPAALPG